MPKQTTKKGHIYYPDGALLAVKAKGEGSFTDVGAISSVITNSLTWTENVIDTANAGELDKQYKAMKMESAFTLITLNPESIERMSGGMLTKSVTTSSPFVDAPDETILSGDWTDVSPVNIAPTTLAGVAVRISAISLTSVTGGTDGPLTADDDYTLIVDSNSPSGYSIVFNTAGTNLTTIVQDIVIDYNSITAIASTKITGGASTVVVDASAIKITHTDDNGKIRQIELYAVDVNSAGFAFNFKGANEEGVEEMPISFTAKIDTSRTSGDQLFAWTVEDGAM